MQTLAQPVTVSLSSVFAKRGLSLVSASEVSLTGNRTPQDLARARMVWPVAGEEDAMPHVRGCERGRPCVDEQTPFDPADAAFSVTLRPMDIRTFIVVFQ